MQNIQNIMACKQKYINITTQIMLPIAIHTAIKLNIADHLQYESKSIEDLTLLCDCPTQMLQRLMRYLITEDIFTIDTQNRYALNEFSTLLLTNHPHSQRNLLLIFNERAMQSFIYLSDALRTGIPSFKHLFGMDYFTNLNQNHDAHTTYAKAMANYSAGEGQTIVDHYNFSAFKVIADIGGGQSDLLHHIANHYPEKKFILFDQPNVIKACNEPESDQNIQKIQKVEGDFFNHIPIEADCYLLKRILHDWDDSQSILLLKNIAKQMNSSTRLLIIDAILPMDNQMPDLLRNKILSALDLQLLCLHGGSERTLNEFSHILTESNLQIVQVIEPLNALISIIEVKVK